MASIIEQLEGFSNRIKAIESVVKSINREFIKIRGTSDDATTDLVSGSYAAVIVPEFFPEQSAVKIKLKYSNRRVVDERVLSIEEYLQIFKKNKRDYELFMTIDNLDATNPDDVVNIKFEIKISKGTQSAHLPVIKEIHAIGKWGKGEFVDLFDEGK